MSGCEEFFVDDEYIEIARTGSYTDCYTINNSENHRVEECLSYVGRRQNDQSACQAIKEDLNGKSYCYKTIATNTNNKELCKEVNDNGDNRLDCYLQIAINKGDARICESLSENEKKYSCIRRHAEQTLDKTSCLLIPHNTLERDACILHFLEEATNEEFCDELDLEASKDTCYESIAPKIKGNLLCQKIIDDKKRNNCHVQLAIALESADECYRMEKIQGAEWRTCITQVALLNNDTQLCNSIDKKSGKESCLRQLQS